jgi:hypothetical protein
VLDILPADETRLPRKESIRSTEAVLLDTRSVHAVITRNREHQQVQKLMSSRKARRYKSARFSKSAFTAVPHANSDLVATRNDAELAYARITANGVKPDPDRFFDELSKITARHWRQRSWHDFTALIANRGIELSFQLPRYKDHARMSEFADGERRVYFSTEDGRVYRALCPCCGKHPMAIYIPDEVLR